MKRFFLEYEGTRVPLPPGDHILGRGLRCWLRFNDPSVSREHVRLTIGADTASIEDLGSVNGSLLNGEPLEGRRSLGAGDRFSFGSRALALCEEIIDEDAFVDDLPKTINRAVAVDPQSPEVGSADVTQLVRVPPQPPDEIAPARLRCPGCGAPVAGDRDACARCGFFQAARPYATTLGGQEGGLRPVSERRASPRLRVDLPVLYVSDSLTFESTVSDLSTGGMFIRSEILDLPGTLCTLTVLPDGASVIVMQGMVRRIVDPAPGQAGGLGIKFGILSASARAWIKSALAAAAAPAP